MQVTGAYLPGDSTAVLRVTEVPEPGIGQVVLRVMASTICGSDIRAIYREHLGTGAEAYQNVVVGHEPCGIVAATGPGCKEFTIGERAVVYHISGCGLCSECRRGYMISCTSPRRQAYGWQRNGGMAEYLLAEEKDLVRLPAELTYTDGAQVACGFGTAYEALCKVELSGRDSILVVGLGPVGLATAALARALGAHRIIGIDTVVERVELAKSLGACDEFVDVGDGAGTAVRSLTRDAGVTCAVDCSGSAAGRSLALDASAPRARIALVGEGGELVCRPSPQLMHGQKTVFGSWVTSTWRMQELLERLVDWRLHPGDFVTHRFPLDKVSEAYALMDSGRCGKVAIGFGEELNS